MQGKTCGWHMFLTCRQFNPNPLVFTGSGYSLGIFNFPTLDLGNLFLNLAPSLVVNILNGTFGTRQGIEVGLTAIFPNPINF